LFQRLYFSPLLWPRGKKINPNLTRSNYGAKRQRILSGHY